LLVSEVLVVDIYDRSHNKDGPRRQDGLLILLTMRNTQDVTTAQCAQLDGNIDSNKDEIFSDRLDDDF
jgi:hypothetical protein